MTGRVGLVALSLCAVATPAAAQTPPAPAVPAAPPTSDDRQGDRGGDRATAPDVTTTPPVLAPPAPAPAIGAARARGPERVEVLRDDAGFKLQVGGRDFMVFGMNWSYEPVGHNYSYSLWTKPDAFIERVLDRDMGLLRDMGVNAIRQTPGIPPRWVAWIHRRYGIYTAINHYVGRYGATIDGVWYANVDYGSPKQRAALKAEVLEVVDRYRGTPGVLMWILGNENNYGLTWTSAQPEALPIGVEEPRAAALYSLYGEIIDAVHAKDSVRPVAIANGDLQYVDLIAQYCDNLDILGTNVYRGRSARDLFDVVRARLDLPVMFTEFGADAFNARTGREDPLAQAEYLLAQWQEIYEQSYGKGRAANAIGGIIFQWADGWWKHGQTYDLDVHDTAASWPNDAYPHDFVQGANNMNEEWFGIAAIEPLDADDISVIRPRTAYDALKRAFALEPYAASTTAATIRQHFGALRPRELSPRYEASRALAEIERLERFHVSDLRVRIDTVGSGGRDAPERRDDLVIDHTESFFVDFEFRPSARARASVSINLVGNVAQNRLDPLFYENRTNRTEATAGLRQDDELDDADPAIERLAIYAAALEADYDLFSIAAYYRVGHNHWGYEGDLFGLYREAYYGPTIDIYQANAPFGAELTGKGPLAGLELAFGPEIYWGANPSIIAKYRREVGGVFLTAVHQEDLASAGVAESSAVVPEPVTRRSTLAAELTRGRWGLALAGIFAGQSRVGESYLWAQRSAGGGYLGSGYDVYQDEIELEDTLGIKGKLTADFGRVLAYARAGIQGLVADGGGDPTVTYTGWTLKPPGRGNHWHAATGFVTSVGALQIGPNVLYQRPLVTANPSIDDQVDPASGRYFPAVRPRNVAEDPFAVLDNGEALGGELMLVWDPTPDTWFWAWDATQRESAALAGALSFVYRHQPSSRDSNLGFLADGTRFSFDAAPPAHDVWEARLRLLGAPSATLRYTSELYVARDQSRGSDPRVVTRYGGSTRLWWRNLAVWADLRIDDWGPYDYYRDYNLTYPLQLFLDTSYGMRSQALSLGDVRVGLRGQLRTLDEYSPGFAGSEMMTAVPSALEYEVLSYLAVNL